MSVYKWMDGEVSPELPIKQVYGIVFSKDGEILLKKDGKNYSLPGGKPEQGDSGIEDTLKRELDEEVNVSICNIVMIGYQLVDEQNNIPPYAQVRMAAAITRIGDNRPDPDTGRTYERILVSPKQAAELLNWGDVGKQQIQAAVFAAKSIFHLAGFSELEHSI